MQEMGEIDKDKGLEDVLLSVVIGEYIYKPDDLIKGTQIKKDED